MLRGRISFGAFNIFLPLNSLYYSKSVIPHERSGSRSVSDYVKIKVLNKNDC